MPVMICESCGRKIPEGWDRCPDCDHGHSPSKGYHGGLGALQLLAGLLFAAALVVGSTGPDALPGLVTSIVGGVVATALYLFLRRIRHPGPTPVDLFWAIVFCVCFANVLRIFGGPEVPGEVAGRLFFKGLEEGGFLGLSGWLIHRGILRLRG